MEGMREIGIVAIKQSLYEVYGIHIRTKKAEQVLHYYASLMEAGYLVGCFARTPTGLLNTLNPVKIWRGLHSIHKRVLILLFGNGVKRADTFVYPGAAKSLIIMGLVQRVKGLDGSYLMSTPLGWLSCKVGRKSPRNISRKT